MGRDKRRRSMSTESANSQPRRKDDKEERFDRGKNRSREDKRRSRSPVNFERRRSSTRKDERRPCSRSTSEKRRGSRRRNERHSYVQSSIRDAENSDCDINERLARLECLIETVVKRTSKTSEEKYVRCTIRSDCIPEFEPGKPNLSASKWLEKIDQLAAINGWDENTTIYHMQNRLAGLAKNWYGNLNSYNRSWIEWKELIRTSFPEHHDFATSLKKLVRRTKERSETMTEYYFAKMNLLQACKITGKDAVSCLIDGLQNPTIQTGAKAGRYNSPEELYSDFLSSVNVSENDYSEYPNNYGKRGVKYPNVSVTNKHAREESSRKNLPVKLVKCFNCNEKGHVSVKCNKPKVECKNCNRLGHTANNCSRPNSTTVKYAEHTQKEKNECYFVNCEINQKCVRGYVDTGCSVILLKEQDARELNLDLKPCHLSISGYGGGSVKVIGKVDLKLKVDLAEAEVEALVVPDVAQQVSILIGQTFINNKSVSMVIQNNRVRLFNKEDICLPQIEKLPPAKVALWAKGANVIPPNSVGFIEVDGAVETDVFVKLQYRPVPSAEHWISTCVTRSKNGLISIANVSQQSISFNKDRVIARGVPCEVDSSDTSVSTLKTCVNTLDPFELNDIENQIDKDTDISIKTRILELLNRYRDCFAQNLKELGKTQSCEMEITLKSDSPVVYKAYRMPYSERETVRKIVDELLENNIIRESNSPFSSPILLVKKKTGEYRMCVDFRKLNANTIKDHYPLPRIDDQIERLKGCRFFTSLDLASGYYQIPVSENSIKKTAFITPDGHYEYLRMPFGLANAPAVFQRAINSALGPLRFDTALAYMDDVLVPTENIEKGFKALQRVLECFKKANLTLRLQKCFFFKTKIDHLGYQISSNGIQPGTRKIVAVSNYPRPSSVHQIRQFLGLASYFRKFICNFASIAKPLTNLLKKNAEFSWEDKQEEAFKILKRKLSEQPLLALYDHKAQTELHTDASKNGIAGVLLQKQSDGNLKPISYYSRMTTKEEERYHSYELETLAVVCSLKHFRTYLIGIEFKVLTDCNAIRSALTKRDLIPRIGRWWLTVQEYNFTVEYRAGTKMTHVDALSRNPILEETDKEVLVVDITTDDWILVAQLRDENCKRLIEILSRKPENVHEKKIHEEYSLKNNRLYKNTEGGKKWVVPKTSRKEIVMCHHDNIGHFSLEKTMECISRKYWFASMRKYIKNYIDRCLGCIYNKVPAGKSPGFLNVIDKMNVPMHTVHVDHLGPFVKSSQGNTHLLVIVDGFTKFIFMKPVPNTKVGPVIKTFDEIIDMFGVPNRIVCDRGSCFTSKKFTEYCKALGIKRILNATATPRANGQAERYNRTILSSIAASNEDETKWDKVISSIRWGLNITRNKATGKSPYEVLLGYEPRSANDSFLANEVCEEVRKDLQEVRAQASSSIKKQQTLQKKYYDSKRCESRTYEKGQYVVVRRPKGSNDGASRKLLPQYSGPYVITKVLDYDRYVIEDIPSSTRSRKKYTGISPGDKLKPYEVECDEDDADSDTN